MSRDKPSYYEKTSPTKGAPYQAYQRKLDTLESTKPTRSQPSFLNESKENIPSSLSGGMRDVLLMKCKQAIEELHLELEGEKKIRQQIEEALTDAENEAHEKDSQLREMRYKNEKQQDEIRTIRIQNDTLRKELEQVEDQSRGLRTKEMSYNELQRDFQNVCKANNELKEKIEDLKAEVDNRDLIIKQWNDTLGSVQDKIIGLEKENSELKEEYQTVIEENGKLQRLVKEVESSLSYLRDKYDSSERLTQQLQKENKILDNLREQNVDLRDKIQEYERRFASFNEENHLNNLRLEERFLKEKEELEETLKDRSRRKINELQETFDLELLKLKEANDNTKNDYYKVKGERDVLKQELARVQDRLDLLELENKKITSTFSTNYESLERKKADEIERLKGVNEDQKRLLASYEKMLETEKAEHAAKAAGLSENNTKLREEVLDLKTKNEYLSNKLKDCQEELAYLRSEVNRTFKEEEDKQDHLIRKMNNLETEIVDRNTAINTLNSQLDHFKVAERKQAEEIEALARENREILEELDITKKQVADLIAENDDLRLKQKEFYEILQGKITQISEEVKQEREKRIQAQNMCKSHEEYIVELEAKLRSYKKLSANNPEKSTTTRQPTEPAEQANWAYKKNYPPVESSHRHEQVIRSSHHTAQDLKSRESRERDPVPFSRDSAKRSRGRENSFDRSREIDETPQRLTEPRENNTKVQDVTSPETVHYTFINRFKSVIEKLENKLESITADIDNSAT